MKTAHASMMHFETKNNQLTVADKTMVEIEHLVGSTPFYVYDKQTISNTITELKSALPASVKLHYAIKANPYPHLVHFIKSLVDGFDVASKNEMLLALQTGMPANEISFAGPGKSDQELTSAIIAGVTLHVESVNEIKRALLTGDQLKVKPNIAIRVNPNFELKTSGMKMAGGSKPFGIDEEVVFDLLANIDYTQLNFKGFHIFPGSQNLNSDALIETHNKTFKLAEELVQATPVTIDYINIGGGLGIPYFPGEKWLDLSDICTNLRQLSADFKMQFHNVDIVMELGRYLVGKAGLYVTKVVDLKNSRGSNYAICDGGLHHHLANSGNFGQVIRKNYPVAIANKMSNPEEQQQPINIVGPLCTPLDVLANKVDLPQIEVDDYVVVFQSGAYGASASPKDFLSQTQVCEILL